MTAPSGGGRRGGRAAVAVVAVIGALLLVGAFTVDRRSDEPYDPASFHPEGTHALVELVEHFGAEVEVPTSFPAGTDADVAIAFEDVVPSARNDAVLRWVAEGNTLIMADAVSELTPASRRFGPLRSVTSLDRGECDIAALSGVAAIDLGPDPTGLRYQPAPGLSTCFADEDGAFVVVRAEGAGRIVGLVSGDPFQNRSLGQRDNAALATALVAPRPGTRVAVLTGKAFPGDPDDDAIGAGASLGRLLTDPVKVVLVQLGVALLLFALACARRVGRPVAEPQPVQIAGSALVGAMGDLYQRRADPEPAARLLRADLRRAVATSTGLPESTPPATLAEAVAARTGRTPGEARAVLDDYPLSTNAELVSLADQVDAVREEVLHGRSP